MLVAWNLGQTGVSGPRLDKGLVLIIGVRIVCATPRVSPRIVLGGISNQVLQQVDRLLFVVVSLIVSLADVDLSLPRLKLIVDFIWVTNEIIKHVVKLLFFLNHAMLIVLSLMMVPTSV